LCVPVRALIALSALVAALAACGGADEAAPVSAPPASAPAPGVSERSFAELVAAEAVRGADVEATPGPGLVVTISAGLNWARLALDEAYADYGADPARRDEIVASAAADAVARLEEGFGDATLGEVRADLKPLLEPRFRLRRLPEQPAERRFLENLVVVYVVDREDSFILVTREDLARWGSSLRELHRIAIANLVRETEALLCEEELCGWASGDGYDATRMIVPKLRRDIVGEIGPAVYAVPQENVFVALPVETADRIRSKVLEQFTTSERPVSPDVFVERKGKLVVSPK
jgi:hypothetical protein